MEQMSRDGLRLLPSKKNPRVKRWQATQPQGKAAVPLRTDELPKGWVFAAGSPVRYSSHNGKKVWTKRIPDNYTVNPQWGEVFLRQARNEFVREVAASGLLQAMGLPAGDYGLLTDDAGEPAGVYSYNVDGEMLGLTSGPNVLHTPLTLAAIAKAFGKYDQRKLDKLLTKTVDNNGLDKETYIYDLGTILGGAVLLDDPDRHHGNIILTPEKRLVPIDFGMAKPPHVVVDANLYGKAIKKMPIDQRLLRLKDLRDNLRLGGGAAGWDAFNQGLAGVLERYYDLDWDDLHQKYPTPESHRSDPSEYVRSRGKPSVFVKGKGAATINVKDLGSPLILPTNTLNRPYQTLHQGQKVWAKPIRDLQNIPKPLRADAVAGSTYVELGAAALLKAMGVPTADYGLMVDQRGQPAGVYSHDLDAIPLNSLAKTLAGSKRISPSLARLFPTNPHLIEEILLEDFKDIDYIADKTADYLGMPKDELLYGYGRQLGVAVATDDRDRHGGNVLVTANNEITGIDYGAAFPPHFSRRGSQLNLELLNHGDFNLVDQIDQEKLWRRVPTGELVHVPLSTHQRIELMKHFRDNLHIGNPATTQWGALNEGVSDVLNRFLGVNWDDVYRNFDLPEAYRADPSEYELKGKPSVFVRGKAAVDVPIKDVDITGEYLGGHSGAQGAKLDSGPIVFKSMNREALENRLGKDEAERVIQSSAYREMGSTALLQEMGLPTADYGLVFERNEISGIYSPKVSGKSLDDFFINSELPNGDRMLVYSQLTTWDGIDGLLQRTGVQRTYRPGEPPREPRTREQFFGEDIIPFLEQEGWSQENLLKGLGQQLAISALLDDRDRHYGNMIVGDGGLVTPIDFGMASPPQMTLFGNYAQVSQGGKVPYIPTPQGSFIAPRTEMGAERMVATRPKDRPGIVQALIRGFTDPLWKPFVEGMQETLDLYHSVDMDKVEKRMPLPDWLRLTEEDISL